MLSFHVKFVQTDRRTMVKQYPTPFDMGGGGKREDGIKINALERSSNLIFNSYCYARYADLHTYIKGLQVSNHVGMRVSQRGNTWKTAILKKFPSFKAR